MTNEDRLQRMLEAADDAEIESEVRYEVYTRHAEKEIRSQYREKVTHHHIEGAEGVLHFSDEDDVVKVSGFTWSDWGADRYRPQIQYYSRLKSNKGWHKHWHAVYADYFLANFTFQMTE